MYHEKEKNKWKIQRHTHKTKKRHSLQRHFTTRLRVIKRIRSSACFTCAFIYINHARGRQRPHSITRRNSQCRPPNTEKNKKTKTRPMGLIKMLGDEKWLKTVACERESGQLLHLAPTGQLSKLPRPVVTCFYIQILASKRTGQLQLLSATTKTQSTGRLGLLMEKLRMIIGHRTRAAHHQQKCIEFAAFHLDFIMQSNGHSVFT